MTPHFLKCICKVEITIFTLKKKKRMSTTKSSMGRREGVGVELGKGEKDAPINK